MKSLTTFQDHEVWQIVCESSRILVAAEPGARLLTWEIDSQPIIYWPDHADWHNLSHVRGGNPILFPFVARHMVDGVLGKWRDESGKIYDLPMHGFARDMAFAVVDEADPQSLRLRLTPTPATRAMYPFEWQFDVVYHLTHDTLEVNFETTNTGDAPLPYYAGHHFYFAVPHIERPQWSLSLPCREWGWQNPDGSVRFAPATKTDFTLDDPGLIDRFHLQFTADEIHLKHPGQQHITLELVGPSSAPATTIASWYDVTTWTQEATSDFFCIEPWLGLPNAIHHGYGLRHLAPGQTETAICRITASLS